MRYRMLKTKRKLVIIRQAVAEVRLMLLIGLLWFWLVSGTVYAETRLELSGKVTPAFDFALTPFNDGFALRNNGNALALFQIGSRDRSGRKIAWLRQAEQLLLRTDYIQKPGGRGPVEIRILAP